MSVVRITKVRLCSDDPVVFRGADLKGEPGENSRSSYQLAVGRGYDGTEAEWLESLHDKPGQDLKLDAVGGLSERTAYDDKPQGFAFGSRP